VPFGRGRGVVIESGAGFMVSEKVLDAVWFALSLTCTVKLKDPLIVGLPLISPVLEKFRPPGNVLDRSDHV
jgi:hypothetical protein